MAGTIVHLLSVRQHVCDRGETHIRNCGDESWVCYGSLDVRKKRRRKTITDRCLETPTGVVFTSLRLVSLIGNQIDSATNSKKRHTPETPASRRIGINLHLPCTKVFPSRGLISFI